MSPERCTSFGLGSSTNTTSTICKRERARSPPPKVSMWFAKLRRPRPSRSRALSTPSSTKHSRSSGRPWPCDLTGSLPSASSHLAPTMVSHSSPSCRSSHPAYRTRQPTASPQRWACGGMRVGWCDDATGLPQRRKGSRTAMFARLWCRASADDYYFHARGCFPWNICVVQLVR